MNIKEIESRTSGQVHAGDGLVWIKEIALQLAILNKSLGDLIDVIRGIRDQKYE